MEANRETLRRRVETVTECAGLLIALVIGVGIGYVVRWATAPSQTHEPGAPPPQPAAARVAHAEVWTCPMHPQVRMPGPGRCPICEMPLERSALSGAGAGRTLTISESARKLMEIETSLIERKYATATVHIVGKVDYDETRLAHITAWVPGRLDRLFVDYVGVPVRQGDHMVEIYSPELLSAQEELLQAIKAVEELKESNIGIVRETTEATVTAAREKLRLWGLTGEQIAAIEQRGKADDRITIYAPAGGVVIDKHVQQGAYVKTGTRIYTIADLSQVWIKLDAYESDLASLAYGQKVQFAAEAYPGQTFSGTVSFISPLLDSRTRTVKVRVNAPNAEGKLKPGMFVRATVSATLDERGKVLGPSFAGKWVCPMHPAVISERPEAKCSICGMALERAESLGIHTVDPAKAKKPLVIPASAVLKTGRRAIVYVDVTAPGGKPTFEGREVVLGPRAGKYYLVRGGLAAGQRVVTRGNFLIDSAMQLQYKPSMMSPEGGTHQDHRATSARPAVAVEFRRQLQGVFDAYIVVHDALASSRFAEAAAGVREMKAALTRVDMKLLPGKEHVAWMGHAGELGKALARAGGAKDIAALRKEFAAISNEAIALARYFRPLDRTLYRLHCPMAFDNAGADWLQADEAVRNPYEAETMPKCGLVKERFAPAGGGEKDDE